MLNVSCKKKKKKRDKENEKEEKPAVKTNCWLNSRWWY